MSPTSYQAALPRNLEVSIGGRGWGFKRRREGEEGEEGEAGTRGNGRERGIQRDEPCPLLGAWCQPGGALADLVWGELGDLVGVCGRSCGGRGAGRSL